MFAIEIAGTPSHGQHQLDLRVFCLRRCAVHGTRSSRHCRTTPSTLALPITTVGSVTLFGIARMLVVPCEKKGCHGQAPNPSRSRTSSQHVPVRAARCNRNTYSNGSRHASPSLRGLMTVPRVPHPANTDHTCADLPRRRYGPRPSRPHACFQCGRDARAP